MFVIWQIFLSMIYASNMKCRLQTYIYSASGHVVSDNDSYMTYEMSVSLFLAQEHVPVL